MIGSNTLVPVFLICLIAAWLSGCEPASSPSETVLDKESELSGMHEWSVLQGVEYKYRFRANREPFIIIERANGSNLNVIGLPISDHPDGYTWVIANPTSEPAVKQLPSDSAFTLTKDQYDAISATVQMHPKVAAFLRAHISALSQTMGSWRSVEGR